MGVRSLRHAIPIGLVLWFACLAPVRSVAQDLPQCFIGSSPCGTPEALYRQIRKCLLDPALCRDPAWHAAEREQLGSMPVLPAELAVVHDGHSPPASNARSPVSRHASLRQPLADPARSGEHEVASDTGSATAVDEAARDLPLDDETRRLTDTMPVRPAVIALRLGLRRTSGVAIDMRGRSPSTEEIVQALAPRQRVPQ